VGASSATLWLLGADRARLDVVAASDPADRSQPPIDVAGESPLAHAIRTAEAVFLGSREEHDARFPAWRATEVACAILPVVADAAPIGVVCFGYDHVRSFAEPDRAFKAILARQCALALERVAREGVLARLYGEERDAHLQAEQATRAREEILSVVSHDLRNPLDAIMMGATALLGTGSGPRQRSISERIHRQAARMARLIEDLVDFAGIEAGQLALRREAHPPDEMVAAVSDLFEPLAEERGLRFAVEVPSGVPAIDCDSDRVVQVLSNLVSNALKVTPRGGTIAVGVRPDRVFYVRDTGPGIAPDELPKLFERYWRGKSSHYKGAGLGLSIARGIVAAHGGKIWAESEPGVGSTFLFSLS
jgi:signal transduction histidine kinase